MMWRRSYIEESWRLLRELHEVRESRGMAGVVSKRLERVEAFARTLLHDVTDFPKQRLKQSAYRRAENLFARQRRADIGLARKPLKP